MEQVILHGSLPDCQFARAERVSQGMGAKSTKRHPERTEHGVSAKENSEWRAHDQESRPWRA
jgi:hypothetical protein